MVWITRAPTIGDRVRRRDEIRHVRAPGGGRRQTRQRPPGPRGAVIVAVVIGLVESATARLRLPRVKQFLVGASALGAVALAAALFARGTP
jgi:hypothetical protein